MIKLEQAVIVEGKYDKIKLTSIIDGVIIVTNGFGIFKDKEKLELIRYYAEKTGIIILTDSDNAGRKIRGYIKGAIGKGTIKNVHIPDIFNPASGSDKGIIPFGIRRIHAVHISCLDPVGKFHHNDIVKVILIIQQQTLYG